MIQILSIVKDKDERYVKKGVVLKIISASGLLPERAIVGIVEQGRFDGGYSVVCNMENLIEIRELEEEIEINIEEYIVKCENDFIILTRWEQFETGERWDVEDLIESMLHIITYKDLFQWFKDLFYKYYDNIKTVQGILRILSRIDGDQIDENAIKIAEDGLNYTDKRINDYALMDFSNWELPKTLDILEKTKYEIKWLDDYRIKIIKRLKERNKKTD